MINGSATTEMEIRFSYHPPKGNQTVRYDLIRGTGKVLAQMLVDLCPDSMERSVAITKLDEVVMWANAAIARRE